MRLIKAIMKDVKIKIQQCYFKMSAYKIAYKEGFDSVNWYRKKQREKCGDIRGVIVFLFFNLSSEFSLADLTFQLLKFYFIFCYIDLDSPNNGEHNAPATYITPPREISSTSNGLHLAELLAKGVTMKTPKHKRFLPRLLFALQKLMVRPCCWKQHLHNPLNMEKLSWYLTTVLTLLTSIHGTRRYSACYLRRKVITNPETNSVAYHKGLWDILVQ